MNHHQPHPFMNDQSTIHQRFRAALVDTLRANLLPERVRDHGNGMGAGVSNGNDGVVTEMMGSINHQYGRITINELWFSIIICCLITTGYHYRLVINHWSAINLPLLYISQPSVYHYFRLDLRKYTSVPKWENTQYYWMFTL